MSGHPDSQAPAVPATQPPIVPPPTILTPPAAPVSQHSGSSGAKKRKLQIADEDAASVASSGPSAFSQSVKQRVAKLDGAYCWQCGATPVQTCHVIGKKDNSFKKMVQDGMISFTTVGDPDNAIPLCGLCHANFDDINYPGFIFLPADLQFFIGIEEKNFAARKAHLQATGQYQPRLSPSAAQYLVHQIQRGVIQENAISGLYQRYTLRNSFPSEPGVTAPGLDTWIPGRGPGGTKHWHGAPMAAINRGFAVLGQRVWKNIGEEKGLLRRLQDLYERELPTNNTGTGAAAVGGGSSSGTGQEHGATGGNGQSSRSQAQPPAQPPPQFGSTGPPSSRPLPSGQTRKHATHESVGGSATDSGIDISSGTSKSKRKLHHKSITTPSTSPYKRRIICVPNSPSQDLRFQLQPNTTFGHHKPWSGPPQPWSWGPSSTSATKASLWFKTFNSDGDG